MDDQIQLLRDTMLRQELMFKEQVRELHRLYQKQKLLMKRERQSLHNQPQFFDFFGNSGRPRVKRQKILDLEQLPEDNDEDTEYVSVKKTTRAIKEENSTLDFREPTRRLQEMALFPIPSTPDGLSGILREQVNVNQPLYRWVSNQRCQAYGSSITHDPWRPPGAFDSESNGGIRAGQPNNPLVSMPGLQLSKFYHVNNNGNDLLYHSNKTIDREQQELLSYPLLTRTIAEAAKPQQVNGFKTDTSTNASSCLTANSPLPKKPLVPTFDPQVEVQAEESSITKERKSEKEEKNGTKVEDSCMSPDSTTWAATILLSLAPDQSPECSSVKQGSSSLLSSDVKLFKSVVIMLRQSDAKASRKLMVAKCSSKAGNKHEAVIQTLDGKGSVSRRGLSSSFSLMWGDVTRGKRMQRQRSHCRFLRPVQVGC